MEVWTSVVPATELVEAAQTPALPGESAKASGNAVELSTSTATSAASLFLPSMEVVAEFKEAITFKINSAVAICAAGNQCYINSCPGKPFSHLSSCSGYLVVSNLFACGKDPE